MPLTKTGKWALGIVGGACALYTLVGLGSKLLGGKDSTTIKAPVSEVIEVGYEWGKGRELKKDIPRPAVKTLEGFRALYKGNDESFAWHTQLADLLDGKPDGVIQQENMEKIVAAYSFEHMKPHIDQVLKPYVDQAETACKAPK